MEGIIFKEAFFTRIVPIFHEVTLTAQRNFQDAHYGQSLFIASIAALLASAMLYGLGVWLRRIPARISSAEQQARMERLRKPALHWLPWLLILSPTPVGNALIIAAGFFGIRPLVAACSIIAAEILWRASPLL